MAENRPEEELYDLSNDPHEMHNLAKDEACQPKLLELRTTLNDWMNETGDQGGVDESQTVNMEELMAEKRKWYERTMERRGLEPSVSDSEYLQWWATELGVE